MTVFHADGVTSELHRQVCRLRAQLPPDSARKCGGACKGEAVEETVRQWVGGTWYDVVLVRCLNVTPLKPEARRRLLAERDLPSSAIVKCNWRQELSRVERPDIPPPTLQTKVEVPKMATKTKTPPCPKCGGTGEKWRIGDKMVPTCRDCVRKQQSESAKKRHLKEAERREHAKRLAEEEADRHFEVEMAALTQADEQPALEVEFLTLVSTNDAAKAERDPLDAVTEQLLAMSLGDLMKRKQPVRVAVFALLRACGEVDDDE